MKGTPTILVVVLCALGEPARAETWIVTDREAEDLCESLQGELTQVRVSTSAPRDRNLRRARRNAFANQDVNALVACRAAPARIEVYYPDGSRLGSRAFTVPAEDETATAAVYVSERIRAERFVAEVAVPVPFAPAVWWLGVGADALFSPGGVAPLVFVTIDAGYRFHRHWSLGGFVSVQPYMRYLEDGPLETRTRLDMFGLGIAYHPVASRRVDLALAARVAAARFGVRGTSDEGAPVAGRRDSVWLAYPAARVALRVALARQLWLRVQGELGALVPRAVISTDDGELGSLGSFAGQAGFALEVHFR